MRNNKNNITLSLEDITSFLRNITSHFTGKAKIITLILAIIMLSFTNITLCFPSSSDISALSYRNSVGVGFTFDPTLSVNISPSDLTISNLSPRTTADSNIINVSVVTNAAYGYTLSANVNNESLVHSNNINTFNSIATDADLSDLEDSEDTNIWGYSTSLDSGATWSNYNGLSSSNSTTLLDANSNVSSNLDFKIAAKASSTQASGTYTGVINFTAVSNVAPMSLLDSFIASGAEQLNGYYKMQDMTHDICNNVDIEESELQLIDVRDNKVYWVAKLKDGNCWMTQNLDLDLDSNKTYTHWDTDLGWSTENSNTINENATWRPIHSTIDFTIGSAIIGWQSSNTEPYSANPGGVYFYTSDSDADDIQYNSLQECINARHNDCAHYHAGNYYNWPAAVASNDMSDITGDSALDSVCPGGWKLPIITNNLNDFSNLLYNQNIITEISSSTYTNNGFSLIRRYPVFFIRSGGIFNGSITFQYGGLYWSSTMVTNTLSSNLMANKTINIKDMTYHNRGLPVRCLAR